MAKSADQKQATPPSSLPAYVFRGPDYVAIRTRTNDQPSYVDTRQKVWTWYDGGIALKIDWSAIQLNSELIEIGKGFMADAQQYLGGHHCSLVRNLAFRAASAANAFAVLSFLTSSILASNAGSCSEGSE